MKKYIILPVLLSIQVCILAQTLDAEIDKLAKSLTEQLNAKKIKRVAVADFTYKGMPNTRIGVFLANELSTSLTMSGGTFSVINREEVRKALYQLNNEPKKKTNVVGALVQGLTVSENEKPDQTLNELVNAGAVTAKGIFSSDKALKGVDIIIFGTIEDKGEGLRLVIEATKNNSQKDNMGGARGNITKTNDISDLLVGEVVAPTIVRNNSNTTTDGGKKIITSSGLKFKHQTLTFELIGCSQTPREIECKLNTV
jgi:hypothetical protein